MLPIAITDADVLQRISALARAGIELEVDLPKQEIRDAAKGTVVTKFDVESFRKHCLVHGLDDIGLTMQLADKITRFEEWMVRERPWIGDPGFLRRVRTGQVNGGPHTNGTAVQIKAQPVPTTNRGEEKTEPLEW